MKIIEILENVGLYVGGFALYLLISVVSMTVLLFSFWAALKILGVIFRALA